MDTEEIISENKGIKGKMVFCIKLILFITIFFLIYQKVNYVLRDKIESEYVINYLEEKRNSIDVVFLGSSNILSGIQPMILWEEYGIPSYNLATSSSTIPMMYYFAKLSNETQKPKVIVADMNSLLCETKIFHNEWFHIAFDSFDGSWAKTEAVFDLIEEDDRLEMLFPIYIYHERWGVLEEADFKPIENMSFTKGAKILNGVCPLEEREFSYERERESLNEVVLSYTEKMIQYCQRNNIELVFMAMPLNNKADDDFLKMINELQMISEENNICFLNGYAEKEVWGLNYKEDYVDDAHVNYKGAKKITEYVGKCLAENFGLKDKRLQPEYEDWNKTFLTYSDYVRSLY